VGVEATESFCPADTLFSALCLTLRQWESEKKLENWLEGFPPLNGGAPPPLRLSSALPYAGEVLFFPKPMAPANLTEKKQQSQAKSLKKIAFVSEGIFRAWLGHEELNQELHPDNLLHGGKVWVTSAERPRREDVRDDLTGKILMWDEQTLPRVAIDRITYHSAVYQAGVLRFKAEAGLFVLVEFLGDAKAERDRLTTLLQVLGHNGLGGERSSGYGQFELQDPETFKDLAPSKKNRFLTLSPYHPTWSEVEAGVLGSGAAYELQTRRGWVGSLEGMNLRRRAVRVLGEGSILQHAGVAPQPSYGDLADVTPRDEKGREVLGHKIWRYGIAFPVPVSVPLEREEED